MPKSRFSSSKSPRIIQGDLLLGRNAGQRTLLQMPAIPVACACAIGILLGKFLSLSILSWFGLAVGVLAITLGTKWLPAPGLTTLRFPILVFAACSMAAWTTLLEQPPPSGHVSRWAPPGFQPTVVKGVIASTVELRPNPLAEQRASPQESPVQSTLELRLTQVRDGDVWKAASGKVRMVVKGDVSDFLIGDQVDAYGQLSGIGPPTNPGETDFRKLFAARGIGGRLVVDSVDQIVRQAPGMLGPMRLLSWISSRGDKVLRDVVGDDHAQLASAIVLGRRMAVPQRTRDLLVETGTVHLLSVSGLHLAMVASIARMLVLLTGLNRTLQMILVLSACVFFAGLTGANPPVLRASFLVAAVLFASWSARISHTINSLAIAAIILMILHPNTLLETGAQLSFIAVATLVVTGRSLTDVAKQDIAIQKVIEESQSRWYVRLKSIGQNVISSTKVSFWVWIVTAPLVWQAYHVLAPVSILANLVVVPLLAVALTFGLLTTAVGLITQTLAIPFGLACKIAIASLLSVANVCSEIPGAFFWLPSPPTWLVTIYYLGLLLPTLAAKSHIFPDSNKFPHRFRLGWSVLWFAVAIPVALNKFQTPSSDLKVTFIDVGHGTSVLLELPNGEGNWLYDAGRLGDPTWSIAPIEDVLWDAGIYSLDGVIISHADADHYNAIPDLLRRFDIDDLYLPPGLLEDPQIGLMPVQHAIKKYQPETTVIHAGSTLNDKTGKTWGKILHPEPIRRIGSDNANSIVLLIEIYGTSILLPGDLESPGTDNILQVPRPRPAGVLMAPHHGSLQQNVRPILDWHRPSIVVVSGGNRAARPEVKRTQSQTGAACYITSELGAIRLSITPERSISSMHWFEDHWQACN